MRDTGWGMRDTRNIEGCISDGNVLAGSSGFISIWWDAGEFKNMTAGFKQQVTF